MERVGERSPEMKRGGMLGGKGVGSPENADLLYEYFPLSVDDWYVPLL